jgi:hypothetical protein
MKGGREDGNHDLVKTDLNIHRKIWQEMQGS